MKVDTAKEVGTLGVKKTQGMTKNLLVGAKFLNDLDAASQGTWGTTQQTTPQKVFATLLVFMVSTFFGPCSKISSSVIYHGKNGQAPQLGHLSTTAVGSKSSWHVGMHANQVQFGGGFPNSNDTELIDLLT